MIKTIGFCEFCDSFSETYRNNFTYEGKRALFDYLQEYEESTGEPVELDTVALCCEFSEYESALECVEEAGYRCEFDLEGVDEQELDAVKEEQARAYLEEHTIVIDVEGGGVIIQDF